MTDRRHAPRQAAARCPICRRLADPANRPFCSPRCADVDLGRWLTEQYRLPDTSEDAEAEGREGDEE